MSGTVAARAGRTSMSTPSISGSLAPARTASSTSRVAGEGVWCTTSSVLVIVVCSSRKRSSLAFLHFDSLRHGLAGAAAVAGVVIGACQPVPAPPVVWVAFEFAPSRLEQRICGVTLDPPRGHPRQGADVELHTFLLDDARETLVGKTSSDRAHHDPDSDQRQDHHGQAEADGRRAAGGDECHRY